MCLYPSFKIHYSISQISCHIQCKLIALEKNTESMNKELNAKISKIYSFAPLVNKQVIPYDKEINHNG